MSGINERIRVLCAAFDRTQSPEILREIRELEFQKRKAEDAAEREQRERAAVAERERRERAAAEKQQVASTDWYAAVDTRIRTHFKDWAWAAIDARIDELRQRWWEHEWEHVLKDAIGGAMGTIGRKVRDGLTRVIEEQQRSFEAKLAEQEKRLLASGNSADEAQGRLREEFKRAIEETVDAFGGQLAELEQRLKAVPGRLPVAKIWLQESVTYEGEVVSYDGSLWQARKDTAQVPGGADWICVARAGRDGLTPNARGAFNVYKKYSQLDVIEYEDASYIARRNNPGICPGDGWQLVARSGRRGPAGERGPRGGKGERGARGEDGREIVSWHLEPGTYRAFPTYADGKLGPELNLRPLFEQYCQETGRAAE